MRWAKPHASLRCIRVLEAERKFLKRFWRTLPNWGYVSISNGACLWMYLCAKKTSSWGSPQQTHTLNYDLQMRTGCLIQFRNYVVVMATLIINRPVLSASLNLQNWDARCAAPAELPKWVQAKTIARYWLCQSLRGLWQFHTLRRTYSQHQKLRKYQHQQQERSIFV